MKSDPRKRMKFVNSIDKQFPNGSSARLWQEGISFYFDGTGFVWKRNPLSMAVAPKSKAWRKRNEGLSFGCTAKGKKEGSTQIKFFVAISYGKGVVLCEPYEGRVDGALVERFVIDHFETAFQRSCNPTARRFLQDGDPSQNSERAKAALARINATVFPIPPRSPELNPIENLFHLVGRALEEQVLLRRIEFETREEFSRRIKDTLETFDARKIDSIIESMPRRLKMVRKAKGGRIKY